jgi:hypothetical protein
MELKFSVMNGFFDRPKVLAALDRAKRKQLSKAGAFIRRRARSSMRRRKGVSAAGSPPSAHSPDPSLKTIFFAYDSRRDTVVVGPVKLNQKISAVKPDLTVPSLMERGGTATIREFRWVADGSRMIAADQQQTAWRRVDLRRSQRPRPGFRYQLRDRKATYPARPFMGPALAAESKNFPDLFKGCIKG